VRYALFNLPFLGPGIYNAMQRKHNLDEDITDIHDGLIYQKLRLSNGLSLHDISLLLNTDGVAIFQSTTHSLWPVWLMITDLPFRERFVIFTHEILHYAYI